MKNRITTINDYDYDDHNVVKVTFVNKTIHYLRSV